MKTTTPKAKRAVKEKLAGYSIVITCVGQKVVGRGDTILDTLKSMDLYNARGKTIIAVTRGGVTKERIVMPQVVMRAFNTQGMTRDISLKLIASQFYGL